MPSHLDPTALQKLGQHFSSTKKTLTKYIDLPSGQYISTLPKPPSKGDEDLGAWWLAYLHGENLPASKIQRGELKVAELFSGPGGLAQGVKQACRELGYTFNSQVAVDTDLGSTDVYRLNHGTKFTIGESIAGLLDYHVEGQGEQTVFTSPPKILDDEFRKATKGIDLLLAGPPCQGHSNLNNHTRRDDERNELYLTVPALAIAANIPGIIIENVPEVIHDREGVVEKTKQLLLNAGYHIDFEVLKADRLGWPQTRKRYFLIARKGIPPVSLSDIANAFQEPAKSAIWAIEDLADHEVDDFMNRQPNASDDTIRRIEWLFDNDEDDLDLSERPDCHKNGTTYTSCYGRMYLDKPAPTLTTGFMTPGRGRFVHPTRRRVLTPREAARIQGFPDTYLWKRPEDPRPPIQAIAKWIGDAVPMPLGHLATLSLLGGGPLT